MQKGLVCDVKRYLTLPAPELQRNTFNYRWPCLVVDTPMSASRAVLSGPLPVGASPTSQSLSDPDMSVVR